MLKELYEAYASRVDHISYNASDISSAVCDFSETCLGEPADDGPNKLFCDIPHKLMFRTAFAVAHASNQWPIIITVDGYCTFMYLLVRKCGSL